MVADSVEHVCQPGSGIDGNRCDGGTYKFWAGIEKMSSVAE
jgi:hypothetical protein